MNNISVTLNDQELNKISEFLRQYEVGFTNGSYLHLYKYKNATITIYKTKVLLIQAKDAKEIYKDLFGIDYLEIDQNKDCMKDLKVININQDYIATVGSDEVGTGDFFGGIVVASAYIKPEQIAWLKSIGINDSKKLSDEKIIELYKLIKNEIYYEVINLDPISYNNEFLKYDNSNVIKAVCHNQALWNLSKRVKRPYFVIIDQFVDSAIYAKYLRQANKTEFTIDVFETKAESKYLAVACASIVARAFFLNQIKQIEEKYDVKLLLGSSNEGIKTLANEILQTKGIDTLKAITKNHFITFKQVTQGE